MAARMDGENYGKLVSYEIPTTLVAPSPAQAATLVESDPTSARRCLALDQRGSSVVARRRAADPGRDIDHLRASDLCRGPGRRAVPAVAVRRAGVRRQRGARRLRPAKARSARLTDGIRPAARADPPERASSPAAAATARTTTTTAPSETTTTAPSADDDDRPAVDERADAAHAGRDRARTPPTRRWPRATSASYQSHVEQAQDVRRPGEPDPGRRLTTPAPARAPVRSGPAPGLFGPPGDCYYLRSVNPGAAVPIPRKPPGRPGWGRGGARWPFPASIWASTSSAGTTPSSTSTRPRRA